MLSGPFQNDVYMYVFDKLLHKTCMSVKTVHGDEEYFEAYLGLLFKIMRKMASTRSKGVVNTEGRKQPRVQMDTWKPPTKTIKKEHNVVER